MPSIHVSVSHKLTQADALKRIKKAIAEAKNQNPEKVRELNESWEGYVGNFSGTAMGHSVAASVAVNSGEVTVDGKLPLLATPFKGKIEAAIQDMLTRLLA
jgi:Putative polyhydroxyalkanoic acid system protein (PHA_gran_rgn)